MNNTELLAMDKDECPDNDAVIYRDMCTGCKHYQGFELYKGLPCIKCSYYSDVSNSEGE